MLGGSGDVAILVMNALIVVLSSFYSELCQNPRRRVDASDIPASIVYLLRPFY